MVKRCAWGTCNSDTCYPERLSNKEGKSIRFYSFPSLKKQEERRKALIRHAVVAIISFVLKTVTFVEFTLLEVTDQLKTIPIQYQQRQIEKRFYIINFKLFICIKKCILHISRRHIYSRLYYF